MARLKSKRRRKLPKSSFAIPSKRLYPIDTAAARPRRIGVLGAAVDAGQLLDGAQGDREALRQEQLDPEGVA